MPRVRDLDGRRSLLALRPAVEACGQAGEPMTAYDRFRRLVEARSEVKGKADRMAEHRTRCPAHDDQTPSLDFREKAGKLVIACRSAGCSPDAIVAALGTSWPELLADDTRPAGAAPRPEPGPRTLYTWHRLDGGTATHVRIGDGPGKQMPWDPRGTRTADLRVYGAELLAGWDPAAPVWWAEGEKAADALRAAGLPAVSWTGKDTAPSPAALAELHGRRVIVWPDNDRDGIAQGHRIAAALDGIAADVRWVDPAGWAPKADAADILAPDATGHELHMGRGADPAIVPTILDRIGPVPAAEAPGAFPEPEDRGQANRSELGEVEYVEDLIRPGRIVVVSGEEGTGKSYAVGGELCIRMAVAGGSFAGTWPIVRTGPVLVLSEMHSDDDYDREEAVLAALERQRADLAGRYYRLPLMTAAGDRPALMVPEWRAWVTGWMRERGVLLLVVDTATGATQVKPWGEEIQQVYRDLRLMLAEHPDLAVALLLHMRKPSGTGDRRLSDVLGEWGRWCDVVLMMENDGASLDRVKLTARKRVKRERRIVATKRGGLLVDPVDTDAAGPKVPTERVVAAITAEPGLSYAELGKRLDVSKDTAARYVKALAGRVDAYPTGERGAYRVYLTAAPPQTAAHADAAVPEADRTDDRRTAARTYIGAAVRAAVVTPDALVAAPVLEEAPPAEDGRGTPSLDHCDCGAAKVTIPGTDRAVCTNPECRPRRVCPGCQHPHPVRTSCADCPACRAPSAADDPPWPTTAPAAGEPVEVTV